MVFLPDTSTTFTKTCLSLSTVYSFLSTICCLLPTVCCLLSTLSYLLSTTYCLLIYCLLWYRCIRTKRAQGEQVHHIVADLAQRKEHHAIGSFLLRCFDLVEQRIA